VAYSVVRRSISRAMHSRRRKHTGLGGDLPQVKQIQFTPITAFIKPSNYGVFNAFWALPRRLNRYDILSP
jgi:hypothetical protein